MPYVYQHPLFAISEVQEEGSSEVVAEGIRSSQDGQLMAAAPELREAARTGLAALEWIRSNVAHMQLPDGLQPIRFHIEKTRAALNRAG